MQLMVVETGKLRGWEVFVTQEKTTGLQVASEWKLLRGSTGWNRRLRDGTELDQVNMDLQDDLYAIQPD